MCRWYDCVQFDSLHVIEESCTGHITWVGGRDTLEELLTGHLGCKTRDNVEEE